MSVKNEVYGAIKELDLKSCKFPVLLKALIFIHRQMLYAPQLSCVPYSTLFESIRQRLQAFQAPQGNPQAANILAMLGRYVELLNAKSRLAREYGTILNSAYVLQPCTTGHSFDRSRNPVNFKILETLTALWTAFQRVQDPLLAERQYLWEVKLSLAVNLAEDQFLLMSLLTQLNFAIKTMFYIKFAQNPQADQTQIKAQIREQDKRFHTCLGQYAAFLQQLGAIKELGHLAASLPQVN